MMRETYSKPISEVEEFKAMDILTVASSVDPVTPPWSGGIEPGEVED